MSHNKHAACSPTANGYFQVCMHNSQLSLQDRRHYLRDTAVGSEACLGFSPHNTLVSHRVMSVLDSAIDMQNPSHLRFMQDAGQHSLQVCSKCQPECSVSRGLQLLKNETVRQNASSYDEPISALIRNLEAHLISSM